MKSMRPMQLWVELATTPAQRERGLMDRTTESSMLFLFAQSMMTPFWNERTLLPLDIFFIDPSGTIVTRLAMQSITESQWPLEYRPTAPYVAALELPRGLVPREVTHLSLGPIDYPHNVAIVTLT